MKDVQGRARILAKIERIRVGSWGDIKWLGEGIAELRIDCGPGYRVYMKKVGNDVIVLLNGGDKSTQDRDIQLAKRLGKLL